jgi:Zn-dependent protease with chaperone function
MSSTVAVSRGRSLRGRALLAVGLTVAFYLLAVGIALVLIVAPAAVWEQTHVGNVWFAIAMAAAGVSILRAIVPPRFSFEPPGPQLTREAQPRLHLLLDEVARGAGQQAAHDVYLDLDTNASVFERRGRRIMVLGLGMLATLPADELVCVVAHEYGHYAAGDTRFSGWIWRTRVTVLRTAQTLQTSKSWWRRTVLHWPFVLYAMLFMRVTNAVSRRAEFAADELAARLGSPDAAGRMLRRISALAPAFDSFMNEDVIPMLSTKRRPPLASGFTAMARHANLAPHLDRIVGVHLEAGETDPYASHPTLGQRLDALGVPAEATAPPPTDDPAVGLLDDVPLLERELLTQHFGDAVAGFPLADWSDAGGVRLELLGEMASDFRGAFPADLTVADVASLAADLRAYHEPLREELPRRLDGAPDEALDDLLLRALGSLVTVSLSDAGASVTAAPGEPILVHHQQHSLSPWDLLAAIASGEQQQTAWAADAVVAAFAATPLRSAAAP